MSHGRVMKDWDGPSEMSGEEVKKIFDRMPADTKEKYARARRVRFIWPDSLRFIYSDNNVEEVKLLPESST